MSPRTRPARLALAALVLAGATTLGGCSLLQQFLPSTQPVRDAESGEITQEQENADVFSIRVGDCLNSSSVASDGSAIDHVPVVPCDQAHEDEVYYSYDLPDGDFPGEDAILADADTECVDQFGSFIGIDYHDSALDYWPMYPTTQSWENGDREVLCIAWDSSGAKLTGSLRGARR